MKPQADFPKLEEFKKAFNITEKTIFAYDNVIYCNYDLTDDLIVHETTHHKHLLIVTGKQIGRAHV